MLVNAASRLGAGSVMPPSSWPEGAIPSGVAIPLWAPSPQAAWAPAVGRVGLGRALLSLFPRPFLLHGAGCLPVSAHGAAGAAGRGHLCARVGLVTGALERGGLPSSALCRLGGTSLPSGVVPCWASPCSTSTGGGPRLAAALSSSTHSPRAGAATRERAPHNGGSSVAPPTAPARLMETR